MYHNLMETNKRITKQMDDLQTNLMNEQKSIHETRN